jgi:hypothetical protein
MGTMFVAARDLNLTRVHDDAQLLQAVQLQRTLVTHNRRDFVMLHDAWIGWPAALSVQFPLHPGILILDADEHDALARAVHGILNASTTDGLANNLLWWHGDQGWRLRRAEGWEPFESGSPNPSEGHGQK